MRARSVTTALAAVAISAATLAGTVATASAAGWPQAGGNPGQGGGNWGHGGSGNWGGNHYQPNGYGVSGGYGANNWYLNFGHRQPAPPPRRYVPVAQPVCTPVYKTVQVWTYWGWSWKTVYAGQTCTYQPAFRGW